MTASVGSGGMTDYSEAWETMPWLARMKTTIWKVAAERIQTTGERARIIALIPTPQAAQSTASYRR
jgi:hypothetical protein